MSCSSPFKNHVNSTLKKYKFVSNLQYSHKKKSPKGVNFPPKSSKNCLKQQVCYPYSKYFEYQYLDCYLCILAHVFVASTHRNPNLLLALRSTCTAWLYSNQAATGRTLGKCSEWWGGSCHCKGYIYVLYSIYNIIIYIIYSPSGPYKSNKSPQLQVANKTKDAYPLTIKLPLHLLWCPEKKRICQSIIEVRQGGIHVTFNKHNMAVSKNRGTPKSSILNGFSIINHPFWDTPIFGNTHIFPFPK